MKTAKLIPAIMIAAMGFTGLAMANCADDAIDKCNEKHPDPDKNYGAYELCLKAQLSQKCPENVGSTAASGQLMAPQQRPTLPRPATRELVIQQPEASRSGR
ncbi:hypothetical protein [Halopseudomonas salegens]|uniref:Uncharacterized protein n=1 Tax=Halopseudomonas salegens TaxID=1434072 RepID=A0A1H2E286_9GAMM|nr:hypothetical protein [Halopseudomonas salegens]SDT89217.1 hypothetical protein SAMN05216210_0248 [Halopseudomonas salegens]